MSIVHYNTTNPVVLEARSIVNQFKVFRETEEILDTNNTAYIAGRVFAVLEAYAELDTQLQQTIILPRLLLSLFAESIEKHQASTSQGLLWKLDLRSVHGEDPRIDTYEYFQLDYFESGRLTPDRELPRAAPAPPPAVLASSSAPQPHVFTSPSFAASPTIAAPTPVLAAPPALPVIDQEPAVADVGVHEGTSKVVRVKRNAKVRAVGPVTRGNSVEKAHNIADAKRPKPNAAAGQPRSTDLICDHCTRKQIQCQVAHTGNCCMVCTTGHLKCTIAGQPVEEGGKTEEATVVPKVESGIETRSKRKKEVAKSGEGGVKAVEEMVPPVAKEEPTPRNKGKRKAPALSPDVPAQSPAATGETGAGGRAEKRRRVIPNGVPAGQQQTGNTDVQRVVESTEAGAPTLPVDTLSVSTLIRAPLPLTVYDRFEVRVQELEERWNAERQSLMQEVSCLRQDVVSLRQENERVAAAMLASRLQQSYNELQAKYDALLSYVKTYIPGQFPTPLLQVSSLSEQGVPSNVSPYSTSSRLFLNRPPLQTPTLPRSGSIGASHSGSPLLRDIDTSSGTASIHKMDAATSPSGVDSPALPNSLVLVNPQT